MNLLHIKLIYIIKYLEFILVDRWGQEVATKQIEITQFNVKLQNQWTFELWNGLLKNGDDADYRIVFGSVCSDTHQCHTDNGFTLLTLHKTIFPYHAHITSSNIFYRIYYLQFRTNLRFLYYK